MVTLLRNNNSMKNALTLSVEAMVALVIFGEQSRAFTPSSTFIHRKTNPFLNFVFWNSCSYTGASLAFYLFLARQTDKQQSNLCSFQSVIDTRSKWRHSWHLCTNCTDFTRPDPSMVRVAFCDAMCNVKMQL